MSEVFNIEGISDITVTLSVELGRTKMTIRELLALEHGSVIELAEHAGSPLKIFANNKLIGYGEVVTVNDKFGIRITDVISS